jgi:hypothetical protein
MEYLIALGLVGIAILIASKTPKPIAVRTKERK